MTTVRDVVRRAHLRLALMDVGGEVDARIGAFGLEVFNDLIADIRRWADDRPSRHPVGFMPRPSGTIINGGSVAGTRPARLVFEDVPPGPYSLNDPIPFAEGYTQSIVVLLARQLSESYGREVTPELQRAAVEAKRTILAGYVEAQPTVFDRTLVDSPTRRRYHGD